MDFLILFSAAFTATKDAFGTGTQQATYVLYIERKYVCR